MAGGWVWLKSVNCVSELAHETRDIYNTLGLRKPGIFLVMLFVHPESVVTISETVYDPGAA
jgi:hypothetical protein